MAVCSSGSRGGFMSRIRSGLPLVVVQNNWCFLASSLPGFWIRDWFVYYVNILKLFNKTTYSESSLQQYTRNNNNETFSKSKGMSNVQQWWSSCFCFMSMQLTKKSSLILLFFIKTLTITKMAEHEKLHGIPKEDIQITLMS